MGCYRHDPTLGLAQGIWQEPVKSDVEPEAAESPSSPCVPTGPHTGRTSRHSLHPAGNFSHTSSHKHTWRKPDFRLTASQTAQAGLLRKGRGGRPQRNLKPAPCNGFSAGSMRSINNRLRGETCPGPSARRASPASGANVEGMTPGMTKDWETVGSGPAAPR